MPKIHLYENRPARKATRAPRGSRAKFPGTVVRTATTYGGYTAEIYQSITNSRYYIRVRRGKNVIIPFGTETDGFPTPSKAIRAFITIIRAAGRFNLPVRFDLV